MSLTPRLIVADPDSAATYYQNAMDAKEVFRAQDDSGRVMVVVLQIAGSPISLSPAVREWGWLSPDDVGGSPVLLEAEFTDQDAVAERMVAGGGTVVVPVENRPYGKREGRLRDPFGHLWIVTGELR